MEGQGSLHCAGKLFFLLKELSRAAVCRTAWAVAAGACTVLGYVHTQTAPGTRCAADGTQGHPRHKCWVADLLHWWIIARAKIGVRDSGSQQAWIANVPMGGTHRASSSYLGKSQGFLLCRAAARLACPLPEVSLQPGCEGWRSPGADGDGVPLSVPLSAGSHPPAVQAGVQAGPAAPQRRGRADWLSRSRALGQQLKSCSSPSGSDTAVLPQPQ